jgi:hypothetical protein
MSPEATIATAKALMKIGRWLIVCSLGGLAVLQVASAVIKAKPTLEKMQADQMRQLQRMPAILQEDQ